MVTPRTRAKMFKERDPRELPWGELGVDAVVVLGHPDYYPKFGFAPSVEFDITSELDVPEEVFMVQELRRGCLDGKSGTIKFHEAFSGI